MTRLVIIASGPSTTDEDIERVRNARCDVLVVNDNYRKAPWADYLWATDADWWLHYGEDVRRRFLGECLIADLPESEECQEAIKKWNLKGVKGSGNTQGLCKEKGKLFWNQNSTGAAMNWAYHQGYDTIILLGVELKGKLTDAYEEHAFRDRPSKFKKKNDFNSFRSAINQIIKEMKEEGVTVINCSRNSTLDLPHTPIEEVL